jgi:acyl transferase domain-containing protein
LEIVAALEQDLGTLPQTLLLEYPTIEKLAQALLQTHSDFFTTLVTIDDLVMADDLVMEDDFVMTGKNEDAAIQKSLPITEPIASTDDIAIISVAGRYPGADTMEELWEVLRDGKDCISSIPENRQRQASPYSSSKGKSGHSYCKWGGFINDMDCFDAEFFGFSPREAALTDPQQRLFLETTWHLLERAGYTRDDLKEKYDARVGVFVGAMYMQYNAMKTDADSQSLLTLSSYASIANRTSFFFDIQGPSVAVDSMCSSGLQAVHQACQSLRFGECKLAIAGGVNLSIHPDKYIALSRGGLIASSADSRRFFRRRRLPSF